MTASATIFTERSDVNENAAKISAKRMENAAGEGSSLMFMCCCPKAERG